LLAAPFASHAVLQRDRPIPVWGAARPGERITVALGDGRVEAMADASGRWEAKLPARPAGGPFTLDVVAASGAKQSASDVLVGDVWLCSGQSNMAMTVGQALNGEREARTSATDRIRLLTIERAGSPAPLTSPAGKVEWTPATVDAVRGFSATCFYFARELRKTIDVPMGLIDSSWGGANAEAWMSAKGLAAVGGFDQRLALLELYARDPAAAATKLGHDWEQWWRSRVPNGAWGEPWRTTEADGWRSVPAQMGDWKKYGDPDTASLHGMVWYRRRFTLTAAQAAQRAVLSLGPIDEVDQTWVNDRPIANTFGWGAPREYVLPVGSLHAGENLIVTNVLSTWDMGGLTGPADRILLTLGDGTNVPLGGEWQYRPVPTGVGLPPRGPWHTIGGLTTLHNAMIAPLAPYGLRGVAWYQGETNADAPDGYEALLRGLMLGWRAEFGADLPFLIVQLPNFGPVPTTPVDNGWAALRDAQRRAVQGDAHAGLAVTIDAGDRHDLHPANKQEVGRRLARAARHVVYGEKVTPSGPAATSARHDGDKVVVTFADIDGKLVAYSGRGPNAFELCGEDQASCRFVDATIVGDTVVLEECRAARCAAPAQTAPTAPATRVRYCWGAGPVCTLYDESGLPAGPFELVVTGG
jgi:sialate O-acetylesterase